MRDLNGSDDDTCFVLCEVGQDSMSFVSGQWHLNTSERRLIYLA